MVAVRDLTGFASVGSYLSGLAQTPRRIVERVGLLRTAEDAEAAKAEGKHQMKPVLGVWDLVAMGVGMILGAGVFVTTGTVAVDNAGCAPGSVLVVKSSCIAFVRQPPIATLPRWCLLCFLSLCVALRGARVTQG